MVCYEDLRSDLPGQVQRIARFMGIEEDVDLFNLAMEQSSFAFMESHQRQFDEHFVFEHVRKDMGIPDDYVFGTVSVSKVRAGGGSTGEGKKLPPKVVEMLQNRWNMSVHSKTG